MKSIKRAGLSLLVGALFTMPASAQTQTTATFLNGGSTNGSYNQGTYRVGVYEGYLPGQGTLDFYCVDFYHNVWAGRTWKANLTSLGSGNLGATRLGSGSEAYYQKAAWLTTQFTDENRKNGLWGSIHAAIWQIMAQPAGNTGPTGGDANGAAQWIAKANSNYQSVNLAYWTVVTDVNKSNSGSAQEFLVHTTPEPVTMVLFGTGLAGVGLARRRRKGLVDTAE